MLKSVPGKAEATKLFPISFETNLLKVSTRKLFPSSYINKESCFLLSGDVKTENAKLSSAFRVGKFSNKKKDFCEKIRTGLQKQNHLRMLLTK